ncbi:exonuclease 3'-5' domain-containing protein 2-like [Ylistrum balloti]|uniref:exonuclease 3'-5' domain-containing protein 2-like n=1 Tax=Ylistrum balloti TaxID=509963 RepID=UPI002905B716|nr:exonuclease 3'-5' domain-containing protein 2-like [Ylistrum balloti]
MATSAGQIVIYGGKGALGSACVSFFKGKGYWICSIDLAPNEMADANILVKTDVSWTDQETQVLGEMERLMGGNKLDAVFCVAGGWAGGNAADKAFVKNADMMWKQSVWTSSISASIASKHLKEGGVLTLPGAMPALKGTPGMIGYGMAKAAIHQLVKSLASDKSGMPTNALTVAILPMTLDTPMNRKFMSEADFTTWTPLEFVAELFYKWMIGSDRPANGSLMKLVTKDSITDVMDRRQISKLLAAAVLGGVGIWAILKTIKTLKNNVKVYQRKKEIFVVQTEEEWEQFYATFIQNKQIKVLGFDCEWVFHGRRHPVALLQLATQEGVCALIRTFRISTFPSSLQQLLKDRSILKVGVAPKDDAKKLFQDYGLSVHGCIDLRHMLFRVRGIYQCSSIGLQGVAEGVLGVTINKDKSVRCGNWEADILSSRQKEYAADDAIVAVDIFTHLVLAKLLNRRPDADSMQSDVFVNESRFWRTSRSLCQGVVDANYKHTPNAGTRNKPSRMYKKLVKVLTDREKQDEKSDGEMDDDVSSEAELSEEMNQQSTSLVQAKKEGKSYMTRQRPLYDNCLLLAPDGDLLCSCDVKKAAWYLERGLADKVEDSPLTVKLRFEPAGRPTDDYYLQDKENICVVCGADESYIRKCVIPREYRKYLPHQLKDHSSHDVLLMCVPCHMDSTQHDSVLRNKLAEECNAPIDNGSGIKVHNDEDLRKVCSAAKALLKSRDKIPAQRQELLEDTIRSFYNTEVVTEELLNEAVDIDYKIRNIWYKPHGKRVVTYMKRHGGLFNFEKRWRKHFLQTMKPKFMPKGWSVSHRHEHHRDDDDNEDNDSLSDLEVDFTNDV